MFILNQDKSNLVNIANVVCIEKDERYIFADCSVQNYTLGCYDTEKRAKEVFDTMVKKIFLPGMILRNCDADIEEIQRFIKEPRVLMVKGDGDAHIVDYGIYEMPEE